MNVFVDPEVCIGCTLCTQICPVAFKMEKDKAIAYKNTLSYEDHECARNAAEQCPVQAISLTP